MANITVKLSWIFCVIVYLNRQKGRAADVDECVHYRNLTGAHRSSSYYDPSHDRCDHNMKPGWCRFTGNAGQMMSTQCVPKFHCSAHGPGWLDGDHPMPQEGRVIRRVCFHIEGDCCAESVEIQVRNCGQFVVYHLVPAPKCPFRYCGNEVKEFSSGYKVPNGCKEYSLLYDVDRAQGFYDPLESLTDLGLTPGWYRFEDRAGTQMANKCIDMFHCGTHATGWLRGKHPAQNEGAVLREVCFHWLNECCYIKQQILVRRCTNFYVYELPGPTQSFMRYCGNGTATHNKYK